MLLQCQRKLGAIGFLHGDVVFNAQRIECLATKIFRHDTGADALARCIHRRGCTCRSAANHQHVKRIFGIELFGFALNALGIDLGQNFFQAHAALAKFGTVQKDGGH